MRFVFLIPLYDFLFEKFEVNRILDFDMLMFAPNNSLKT
jgi:hypothetical protein